MPVCLLPSLSRPFSKHDHDFHCTIHFHHKDLKIHNVKDDVHICASHPPPWQHTSSITVSSWAHALPGPSLSVHSSLCMCVSVRVCVCVYVNINGFMCCPASFSTYCILWTLLVKALFLMDASIFYYMAVP